MFESSHINFTQKISKTKFLFPFEWPTKPTAEEEKRRESQE